MDVFNKRLLDWYDVHARQLPWRIAPQDGKLGILPEPYHVWLSEVMLQQTTVATVKSYFEKFLVLWPKVENLAAADREDVLKAWAGLGYYSRARNLKACSDIVMSEHDGMFPQTQAELKNLPGIGDYTSAAIAAIAFGERAAVVDGNIERVITRHRADATPLPKAKENCRIAMDELTPEERPGDFVQAMMDLGATICTPKNPTCALCPVNEDCEARMAGDQTLYPVKAPKKAKPTRKGYACIIQREDGAVWLEKRAETGLLGGMTTVPTSAWTASKDGETGFDNLPDLPSPNWQEKGTIRHTFTHFHLELEVWHGTASFDKDMLSDGWWSALDALPQEALPTVMKKAVAAVLPDIFKGKK